MVSQYLSVWYMNTKDRSFEMQIRKAKRKYIKGRIGTMQGNKPAK